MKIKFKLFRFFALNALLFLSASNLFSAAENIENPDFESIEVEILENKLFGAISNNNPDEVSTILIRMLKAKKLNPITEKTLLFKVHKNIAKYSSKTVGLKVFNGAVFAAVSTALAILSGIIARDNNFNCFGDIAPLVCSVVVFMYCTTNSYNFFADARKNKQSTDNAIKILKLFKEIFNKRKLALIQNNKSRQAKKI